METIHVFRQQMSSRELQTLKQLVQYVLNRKTIMLKAIPTFLLPDSE
jgi:hypothetical protein